MTEEKKTQKTPGRFRRAFRLIKNSSVSLHHLIWGRGWRRFWLAVGITFIIITVIMIVSMELTSQPRFCNTCHNMRPYYASWKDSSHNHVTCTDCHFPPGIKNKIRGKFTALSMLVNYFTGIYKRNKPWAEIPDESCMRSGCHDTRLLKGKVNYMKSILFDHTPHLGQLRRGKKLRCTSCHSQIVQGDHISVTDTTCFLCHFKKSPGTETEAETNMRKCDTCHTLPLVTTQNQHAMNNQPVQPLNHANNANPSNHINIEKSNKMTYDHKLVLKRNIQCGKCHGSMSTGDGFVPKNRCSTCHGEPERIRHYDNTPWIHKIHITDHKVDCELCHTEIQHKSISRTELVKPDCQACHPQFHNAQFYLFAGKGGKGLPPYPSSMFEAGLNCQACHVHKMEADSFAEKGQTFYASPQACIECHGSGYDKVMTDWINQTEEKLTGIDNALKTAERLISAKKNHPQYSRANQILEDAIYNYNLVKYGKGVHNVDYAFQCFNAAYKMAEDALKILEIPDKLPFYDVTASVQPMECKGCHSGFERNVYPTFGFQFTHQNHLEKARLACTQCHSNQKVHGQLILAKQDCMACHHQPPKTGGELNCKQCHTIQNAIYFSKLPFSTLNIPNVMAGQVDCAGCHKDSGGRIVRSTKTDCTNCHDKDYEQMFVEWQNTSMKLLAQLKDRVKRDRLQPGNPLYDLMMQLEKDGSKGIHNPELYEKLINDALTK